MVMTPIFNVWMWNSPLTPLQLSFADAVRRVNTTDFIRAQLQRTIGACGGQERFQHDWLVNVDQEVIGSFGKLGVL